MSVIPNKLKEELEDVGKVYNSRSGMCVYPNSFSRLQTEIVKVCNEKEILEKENSELKTLIKSEHEIEARKNNSLISQITEAKELLERWLRLYKTNTVKGIITDTEQFLSDELRRRRNTDVVYIKNCSNCKHLAKPFNLCCYSLGDEDYDCHGKQWEKTENENN